ncbi:hypothetical protein F3K40_00860 [Streptomyces sp. LBUM 1478]|nr:hypothetical protein [Streptomyces sp. LBUM 1478]
MKFSAAVWDHADGVRVEEVELLERHPRDVLVRIEASNVASSEASALLGPAPAPADLPPDLPPGLALPPLPLHILGHSAVGVVEEVGPSAEG